MTLKRIALLVVLLWLALLAATRFAGAQNVSADRFVLNTGRCTLRSGSGAPEGVVVGKVCDTYWRTDNGDIYKKVSGTGNTGWSTLGGLGGSGTPGTLAKFLTASTVGDSSLSEMSGNLTIAPTGDIIVQPGGKDILPGAPYDTNLGAPFLKFNAAYFAELWTETLVAQNTLATIGGRVLIAPTTILAADLSTSATTITVKYNNLANGDRVYLEANGQVEFMAVTSVAGGVAGAYTYSVTRNLDGSGANNWYAGDAVLNTGQTGSGFIDLYAVRGTKSATEFGPTIVGNRRNSATYNDWSPNWAIGNCNGLYGYSSNIMCVALGVPTAAWVKVDPTNGVRIGFNTTTNVQIDASGNASFTGAITAASGTIADWLITPGYIYSGATSTARVGLHAGDTATGVAIFAGNFDESIAPFRVLHNGALFASNATISGDGAGMTNINGGNIQTSTITATQIAASTITAGKLNIATLSAITANLGTVTAGTISGVTISGSTINGGSGNEVVINSSGITLTSGTGSNNRVKWSDGVSGVSASSGTLLVDSNLVQLRALGSVINWDGTSFSPTAGSKDLGGSQRWQTYYGSNIDLNNYIYAPSIGTDTGTTVVLSAAGYLRASSSSLRYKEHVRPWIGDPQAILGVASIQFDYTHGTQNVLGFAAEDLYAVDPLLVNLNARGQPESIRTDALLAYLFETVKRQQRRLDLLEARSQ